MKLPSLRSVLFVALVWLIGIVSSANGQSISLPPNLQGKIPFDIEDLAEAPKFRWENKKDSVWSLFYEGGKFNGNQTEVFAYYASPATLSGKKGKKEKYPAIVALHGGGGTAFAVWVREWAKKGYAAIAMDLAGAKPLPEKEQESLWATKSDSLPNGAPDDTHIYKFLKLDEGFEQQWQFHAISNIIRAHSFIRSFSDTDTARTALTGISWGGYLTNIVSGIDHRFKAAVPIYGCGFLQEKSAWLKRFNELGLAKSKEWVELWDPSSYVVNSKMPMLYINGTNDFAYDVESWQKTINLVDNAEQLLIYEMVHNHEKGAEPQEIEDFIEGIFEGKKAEISIESPQKIGKWFESTFVGIEDIQKVEFIYTKDIGKNKERKWEITNAQVIDNTFLVEMEETIQIGYFQVYYGSTSRRISSPIYLD